MKDITEEEQHKSLNDFMSEEGYEVKILKGPCDKSHDEAIEHFKKEGYEIFPHVMPTDHEECSIFMRKKK